MSDAMQEARKFAEWALLARLTNGVGFGDGKRNDTIKHTVARIRAGNGDNLAVVQSAFMALNAIAIEARSDATPKSDAAEGESAGRRHRPTPVALPPLSDKEKD